MVDTESARTDEPVEPEERRVPVTLITGFLGAGKTTLINHLLRALAPRRVGLIINDFGKVGVDAEVLRDRYAPPMIEVTGGCVCCTVEGDLISALAQMEQIKFDFEYLLIESTGLSDPEPIIQQLLLPELEQSFRLDGVVGIVDADQFDLHRRASFLFERQLEWSPIIMLNKVDLVDDAALQRVEQTIQEIAPRARVIRTEQSQIEPHLILDIGQPLHHHHPDERHEPNGHAHDHESPHELDGFQTVSYSQTRPFSLDKLLQALDEMPIEVIRSKGIVQVAGDPRRVYFHTVGNRSTAEYSREWGDEAPWTEIALVGRNLDEAKLRAFLDGCLA